MVTYATLPQLDLSDAEPEQKRKKKLGFCTLRKDGD
jgi:hypothetical protein